MMLTELAEGLATARLRGADRVVTDVSHDSRMVGPGGLFAAMPGARHDGHDHVGEAEARGATAVLVQRWTDTTLPQLKVPDVRQALGHLSARVHGNPSREMTVVGVTGTNGKTTTTHLLEAAFGAAAMGTGTIGTIGVHVHGESLDGAMTTPEAPDLQRLLATMRTRGVDAVGMEVSSHGLDLRRVDGTRFAVAVFTNLSQDHLDWHGTLERYFAAKQRLFTHAFADHAVIMVGDSWSRHLLATTELPVTSVGRDVDVDVRIVEESVATTGGRARVAWNGDEFDVRTRLTGRFNLDNAVLAVVAAVQAGVDVEDALTGVAACPGVPGRMERVDAGQAFTVLVDYAHTPAALTELVGAARELVGPDGSLLLVVGAGGDRDRGKRKAMGKSAAGADTVFLTSDNPRSEEPLAIIAELRAGLEAAPEGADTTVVVEPDRRGAINDAIARARRGDVVLVAGKGHERTQQIGERVVAFDDRTVVEAALRAPSVSESQR